MPGNASENGHLMVLVPWISDAPNKMRKTENRGFRLEYSPPHPFVKFADTSDQDFRPPLLAEVSFHDCPRTTATGDSRSWKFAEASPAYRRSFAVIFLPPWIPLERALPFRISRAHALRCPQPQRAVRVLRNRTPGFLSPAR